MPPLYDRPGLWWLAVFVLGAANWALFGLAVRGC